MSHNCKLKGNLELGKCTNKPGYYTCKCGNSTLGNGKICKPKCGTLYKNYVDYRNQANSGRFWKPFDNRWFWFVKKNDWLACLKTIIVSVGAFSVKEMVKFSTSENLKSNKIYLDNWRPDEKDSNWSKSVNLIELEPKCRLETFFDENFEKQMGNSLFRL